MYLFLCLALSYFITPVFSAPVHEFAIRQFHGANETNSTSAVNPLEVIESAVQAGVNESKVYFLEKSPGAESYSILNVPSTAPVGSSLTSRSYPAVDERSVPLLPVVIPIPQTNLHLQITMRTALRNTLLRVLLSAIFDKFYNYFHTTIGSNENAIAYGQYAFQIEDPADLGTYFLQIFNQDNTMTWGQMNNIILSIYQYLGIGRRSYMADQFEVFYPTAQGRHVVATGSMRQGVLPEFLRTGP